MDNLYVKLITDTPNDFLLGGKVRELNTIVDINFIKYLCDKFPNDHILGKEFREYLSEKDKCQK